MFGPKNEYNFSIFVEAGNLISLIMPKYYAFIQKYHCSRYLWQHKRILFLRCKHLILTRRMFPPSHWGLPKFTSILFFLQNPNRTFNGVVERPTFKGWWKLALMSLTAITKSIACLADVTSTYAKYQQQFLLPLHAQAKTVRLSSPLPKNSRHVPRLNCLKC